jgi:F0F1-type ATP synthase epsilon subunit
LSYVSGGKTSKHAVEGGYVEVRDNHVRVLADSVG